MVHDTVTDTLEIIYTSKSIEIYFLDMKRVKKPKKPDP